MARLDGKVVLITGAARGTGAVTARRCADDGAQVLVTDVIDDLEHIRRSLGKRFEIIPAVCERCDFTFSKRDRLSPPSRCPKCRSERTAGPWVQTRSN